jgi:hypothetical protein
MLGHAKASMTLDTYADLFDDDLDEVADRQDAAIVNDICPELLKVCGAKGIRTPGLLDANESTWAFAVVGRVGGERKGHVTRFTTLAGDER